MCSRQISLISTWTNKTQPNTSSKARSFCARSKTFTISDTDEEIDVTYDKALSRRLLNENVVLRRDAEMKAKFPTKTLLADLEPFLIDIANLPDRARPEDVRVIKERVQKTEIVAALLDYQDRAQTIAKRIEAKEMLKNLTSITAIARSASRCYSACLF